MRGANGFTLIELMISVAIGIGICATGFVAVRSGAHCVAQANRMSLENRLFRSGVAAALDDADFWTSLDDPGDPARQRLRVASTVQANPFRPFPDGHQLDFDHSDERNWWRGPAMPLAPYGDYALFSRVGYADLAGVPDPIKAWYPERLKNIAETLGYFALVDYLPSSSIYQYHDADGSQPAEFSVNSGGGNDPVADPRFYLNGGWVSDRLAGNIVRLTHCFAYAITARDPWADAMARHGFNDNHGVWNTADMHQTAGERWSMLALAPTHWPRVAVDMRRFVYCGHLLNLATVSLRDPVSGSRSKLQFTVLGSTLRGARQQRGLDRHAVNGP
ncbi:MAG: prepilin-type N-terminal cleavage/methylation domain-containing protein [Planctomycetes bacterium]|nr:prepilin-type N-terminal cleavage/methylation domain-containing protein [Planctomycetota bacterium]